MSARQSQLSVIADTYSRQLAREIIDKGSGKERVEFEDSNDWMVLVREDRRPKHPGDRLEIHLKHEFGAILSQVRVIVFTDEGEFIDEKRLKVSGRKTEHQHFTVFHNLPSDKRLAVRLCV